MTILKPKKTILESIHHTLVKLRNRILGTIQWARIRYIPQHRKLPGISVFYLTDAFPKAPPTRQEYAHGGKVKTIYLAEAFPHTSPFANILYAVSSIGHPQTPEIVAGIKRRRLKIIVNQNGVAYPAWHGTGWEHTNQFLKALIDQADHIIYQSRFCQRGAEHFLSPPEVPFDIIYNPVDTRSFTPTAYSAKSKDLTLMLGGNQNMQYRLELALQTLKDVTRVYTNAKLMVTGHLWKPDEDALIWTRNKLNELNLTENVIFTGMYSQQEAPMIFSQPHILLHTQYNDASPTLVLEAMASGLPVVYLDSGGTPELVADAGIGVPVEQSWERINLPRPEEMSNAVFEIMSNYKEYSDKARERVMRLFSLETFIASHRRIFEKVLDY